MAFKIKSLTNTLAKRELYYMETLKIQENGSSVSLLPGQTIYIKSSKLPLDAHKYRIDGLLMVEEISAEKFEKYEREITDEIYKRSRVESPKELKVAKLKNVIEVLEKKNSKKNE